MNKIISILFSIVFVLVSIFAIYQIVLNVQYPILYQEQIEYYAEKNNFSPALIASVCNVESNFDRLVVSPKGAIGLMQIMPRTAVWASEKMGIEGFEIDDLFSVETNLKIGTWYLSHLKSKFPAQSTFLSAYNAGEGTVRFWLNDKKYSADAIQLSTIPFEETKNYISKINKNLKIYNKIFN